MIRKAFVIAGLVTLLTLSLSVKAYANNGPHGGYTDLLTDACAGCHRAHTAEGAGLLTEDTSYELCNSCHGDGSGALTNTRMGQIGTRRLNGGGFESVSGAGVTSAHRVKGLGGSSGQGIAWGGDDSGVGLSGVLECTICHNPHGSTNYRILRDADNGLDPTGSKSRWIANALPWAGSQVLAVGEPVDDTEKYATGDVAYYTQGMNLFCASCHKQYLTNSGSGQHPSTDAAYYAYPGTQATTIGGPDIARYRHAVNTVYTDTPAQPLRLAVVTPGSGQRNGLTCLTCHFAHGSAASVGTAVVPTNDSALLYYNNRGTCRACHQKSK